MVAELTELFKHNLWANLRLLDACEKLTDEQLDATSPGTYGSIRDTLVHIASGEELYVCMMLGQPRPPRREEEGFRGFAGLRDSLTGTGEELIRLAQNDAIPASYLDRDEGVELAGTMVVILAINHATEHRAHINSILSHLGIEPVELDGWAYGYIQGLLRIM
ncbi:MAG: DinB family protein [Chloroflexota bacterium]